MTLTLEQRIVLACQEAIVKTIGNSHMTVLQLGEVINATAELRGGYVGVLMHVMDRERMSPAAIALMLDEMEKDRQSWHMHGEELGRTFAEKVMP